MQIPLLVLCLRKRKQPLMFDQRRALVRKAPLVTSHCQRLGLACCLLCCLLAAGHPRGRTSSSVSPPVGASASRTGSAAATGCR
jgi:hypothetical protein